MLSRITNPDPVLLKRSVSAEWKCAVEDSSTELFAWRIVKSHFYWYVKLNIYGAANIRFGEWLSSIQCVSSATPGHRFPDICGQEILCFSTNRPSFDGQVLNMKNVIGNFYSLVFGHLDWSYTVFGLRSNAAAVSAMSVPQRWEQKKSYCNDRMRRQNSPKCSMVFLVRIKYKKIFWEEAASRLCGEKHAYFFKPFAFSKSMQSARNEIIHQNIFFTA
jgi:hypothetical protein